MSKETKSIAISECGCPVILPPGRIDGMFVLVGGSLRILDNDSVKLGLSGETTTITIGDKGGRLTDAIGRMYGARPESFVVSIATGDEVVVGEAKEIEQPIETEEPKPELVSRRADPMVAKRRGR